MNRRELLIGGTASALLATFGFPKAAFADDNLSVEQTLAALESSDVALVGAGGSLEAKELRQAGIVASAGTSNARMSKTPIAKEAIDLIVYCEVTSPKAYKRLYSGVYWPGGKSGATCGIGYDVGYTNRDRLSADWSGYIPDRDIDILSKGCNLVKSKAKNIVSQMSSVRIEYDIAYRQFIEKGAPRYVGEVEDILFNTRLLSPKSLGALVSLDYNRGASFKAPLGKNKQPDRYTGMRNIYRYMENKEFDKIPDEIANMADIWRGEPGSSGLVTRRLLEAKLFREGLSNT